MKRKIIITIAITVLALGIVAMYPIESTDYSVQISTAYPNPYPPPIVFEPTAYPPPIVFVATATATPQATPTYPPVPTDEPWWLMTPPTSPPP